MKWKGPFEVKEWKGGNNNQIEVNRKVKTFYINLLKQTVDRDCVEITWMAGFPRRNSG